MNKKLYIELLEDEIERLRKENADLNYQVANAKRLYDPLTQIKEAMEKQMFQPPQGLDAIVNDK